MLRNEIVTKNKQLIINSKICTDSYGMLYVSQKIDKQVDTEFAFNKILQPKIRHEAEYLAYLKYKKFVHKLANEL